MSTKIMLENVRLSYAHLFEARSATPDSKPKFSVSVLIDPNDKKNVDKINGAIAAALEKGKEKNPTWRTKLPVAMRYPLRDANAEKDLEKNPEYANMWFMNASSDETRPPVLVNRVREKITDPAELYSGCFANVLINLYPYSHMGNTGIAVGLEGVQFVSDGDRLAGGSSANDFEALDATTNNAPTFPTY